MKIKNFISFALTSVILIGLTTIGIITVFEKERTTRLFDQNEAKVFETYNAASISKGTIFLLLAVGLIGVLGISRKRKIESDIVQNNKDDGSSENQNFADDKPKSIATKS
jgi:hypothetical protein